MRSFFSALLCTVFGHRWKWNDKRRECVCPRCDIPMKLVLIEETSAYLRAAQQKEQCSHDCFEQALGRIKRRPVARKVKRPGPGETPFWL